jgi:hypothetical protein
LLYFVSDIPPIVNPLNVRNDKGTDLTRFDKWGYFGMFVDKFLYLMGCIGVFVVLLDIPDGYNHRNPLIQFLLKTPNMTIVQSIWGLPPTNK